MEGEVEECPDLFTEDTELRKHHPVKVDHIDEVLKPILAKYMRKRGGTARKFILTKIVTAAIIVPIRGGDQLDSISTI